MGETPLLLGYWRSSAAYRVRIAVGIKGLEPRHAFVHLRKGEQRGAAHRAVNPAGLVPSWQEGDLTLAQSLAIIEYLDEKYPGPPLLPESPAERAIAREIALTIACDIHPLGNLRVLDKLSADYGADAAARAAWNRHWIAIGFDAVEARLASSAGRFAVGDAPTLADICLVPQVYNARRWELDLAPYPRILAADAAARAVPAFAAAAPETSPTPSDPMTAKAFASTGDMTEKKTSFTEIGRDLYAFTAEGDPNTGVIVGDDSVMIVDAQATPIMAEKVIEQIRTVTDKPIKYVVLSHYHAVRVLGASAYGASEIIASEKCRAMIQERGQEDWDSEFGRFPRLFRGHESIPGLTWPTQTFSKRMAVYLGRRRVDLMWLGRAHTAGDIVAWVPDQSVMFSGDIVEYHSACYCGDGHFHDWPGTLDAIAAFRPKALSPGRGDALVGEAKVAEAVALTRDFVQSTYRPVAEVALGGGSLKEAMAACRVECDPKFGSYAIYEHCLPFNVARAYDEALDIDTPRIWTAARDREMWAALQG